MTYADTKYLVKSAGITIKKIDNVTNYALYKLIFTKQLVIFFDLSEIFNEYFMQ